MRANSIGQSPLLMLDVIGILNKNNISYAIIGAMAASFYGVVRASMDADAVISVKNDQTKIKKLKQALEKSNLTVLVKLGGISDPLAGLMLIEDKFGNQVDLILGIRGMDRDVFKRVKKETFKGQKINVIGLEDFIAMKVFAGSAKDANDVKGVIEVSGNEIDQTLLKKLTLKYGEEEFKKLKDLLG